MRSFIIIVATIGLICSFTYAADDCTSRYMKILNKIEETDKITQDQKNKYLQELEKALKLCREGKVEEAEKLVDDLRDSAFLEAYQTQKALFGN